MQRGVRINIPGFIGIIILLLLAYFAFKVVTYLYYILLYATPVMMIVIFFMRRELLTNFFKKHFTNIKNNPTMGILNALIGIFLLPFTMAGMLLKAFFYNKADHYEDLELKREQNIIEREYVEYEDISENKKYNSSEL